MGDKDETRNLILAIALSMLVIIGWYALFPPPEPAPPPEQQQAEGQGGGAVATGQDGMASPDLASVTREDALERSDRVTIDTPALSGSISLTGGRIDDLHLKNYRETLDPGAETVTLLNPTGAPNPAAPIPGRSASFPGAGISTRRIPLSVGSVIGVLSLTPVSLC